MTASTNLCDRNSQGEEHKDLGPNASVMLGRIDTKRLKGGQEDDDGGPPVPHGEWQMDKQLVGCGLGRVILLDDIVDVGDGG